jgi:hypothetical protein
MAGIYHGPIDRIDYRQRIIGVPCGDVWIPPSIPLEEFRPGMRVDLVYDEAHDRREATALRLSYPPARD